MEIGMVGLGAMGLPIAKRLLGAGHALRAFDLSPAATEEVRVAGAVLCPTAGETACGSEIVFCSLPNAAIVAQVVDELLEQNVQEMKVIIDLSSIAPESARRFAAQAAKQGVNYLDCPVSGGVGGAQAGTLTVMAGGSPEILEQVLPVLHVIGQKIRHVGPVGASSGIKMINNYLLGCNMAAVAEALVLGAKLGLDLETIYDVVGSSSGRSFIIENKIPNFIKKRSFDGGFAVDLAYKDLGLAMESAKQLLMPTPMGSTAVQVFETARAKGFGRQDITALVKIWENLMDIEVE